MTTGGGTASLGLPMHRWLPPLVLLISIAASASAATLRVARDGSGDFLTLQEALDVAASGDIISMAPGIYDQVFTRTSGSDTFQVFGFVTQGSLTIQGDDRETVLIGPQIPAPGSLELAPIGIGTEYGVALTVRDVTVRYTSNGVLSDGSHLSVSDCKFVGNYQGIDSAAQFGTDVVDCVFEGSTDRALWLSIALGGSGAVISNCDFLNNKWAIDSQMLGTSITDCTVIGGLNGIQSSFGSVSTLTNCYVAGQSNVSLTVDQGSTFQLLNNVVENTNGALHASGTVTGSGNVFSGGTFATVVTNRTANFDFHENHILNGGGWTIWGQYGSTINPVKVHDLSDNFWGTADSNQIRAWILDNTDDSNIRMRVDFEPFHTQPIPTDAISFGELRALFGGD